MQYAVEADRTATVKHPRIRYSPTTRNLLSRHSELSDAVDAIVRDVVEAVSRRVLRSPSDAPLGEDVTADAAVTGHLWLMQRVSVLHATPGGVLDLLMTSPLSSYLLPAAVVAPSLLNHAALFLRTYSRAPTPQGRALHLSWLQRLDALSQTQPSMVEALTTPSLVDLI